MLKRTSMPWICDLLKKRYTTTFVKPHIEYATMKGLQGLGLSTLVDRRIRGDMIQYKVREIQNVRQCFKKFFF